MGQHRCHWLRGHRARGFAIRNPAGREAAIIPCCTRPMAAGTALPELGAGHQNPLEKSDRLEEGPGSDIEPFRMSSCSRPMAGLLLYSLVLVKHQVGVGEWDEAWHTGGVVASINLQRWCCCDRRNMKP